MYWGQLSLQDPCSPLMKELSEFHDFAMLPLMFISLYIIYTMFIISSSDTSAKHMFESHGLESIWTLMPAIILITLALPSLRLLYILDELCNPSLTIKTVGHQWYWSYEYTDTANIEFDSYMIPTEDLSPGDFRLLEVDNRMVVPMLMETRVLVTAADVMHAWTVPSLGVKVDAIPGRLNQMTILPSRPGVFYGQCSEICGANHSFMPIAVESVDIKKFDQWLTWKYLEN
uniref:Cytochrome c oxidase subunit 2 n=1 Tax=Trypanobia cryptica TaxID=2814713 RepID=A0A0K0YD64_9ANNE|nr:cytochrome c oxidase subunit II [Trypanobia cryptica]